MKSIDLAGSPVDNSEQLFQFAGRAPARSSSFPFFSSVSRPSAPAFFWFLLVGVFFLFFLLSFQFPFDVPLISAFRLMEISPGCVSAAHAAAQDVLGPVPGDREDLGDPKGLGRSIPVPWGPAPAPRGLGAGEGPLSSEQPQTWQGTDQELRHLESILSWALLHPSSVSFLPPSPSLHPHLHLHPISIRLSSSSISLPSSLPHPTPEHTGGHQTWNQRGFKPALPTLQPLDECSAPNQPHAPQNPGKIPVRGWEELLPTGQI